MSYTDAPQGGSVPLFIEELDSHCYNYDNTE